MLNIFLHWHEDLGSAQPQHSATPQQCSAQLVVPLPACWPGTSLTTRSTALPLQAEGAGVSEHQCYTPASRLTRPSETDSGFPAPWHHTRISPSLYKEMQGPTWVSEK